MEYDSVEKINSCRICKSSALIDFLSFGNLPIPNSFIKKDELDKKENLYPLTVCFCNSCKLVQLRYIVNPQIMFDNYLYIPSSSQTRLRHFKDLAIKTKQLINLTKPALIVDIGSNDGSLLNCFKNLGFDVVGVDPAENLVRIAELNGIETFLGYFNTTIARKIVKKNKKASVITSTNVVAHVANLHEFLSGIELLLDDNGIFICQFPYLLDLLEKRQFDTIYHEHLSYFSIKPLQFLAEQSKLQIFNIERNDLDGGSIRVYWKKKSNKTLEIKSKKIALFLEKEKKAGIYDLQRYRQFSQSVKKLRDSIRNILRDIKKAKKKIAGYGAAAKGNILLNYCKIGRETISYVVDSTSYKQGLFLPGLHIPIFEEARLYEDKPDYVIILAWNFAEEILEKNKKFKKIGGKFILPIPDVVII